MFYPSMFWGSYHFLDFEPQTLLTSTNLSILRLRTASKAPLPANDPKSRDDHFLGGPNIEHAFWRLHMGVSKNNGTTKSSILIGFSLINHPFWGTPIFGNTHIVFRWINHKIASDLVPFFLLHHNCKLCPVFFSGLLGWETMLWTMSRKNSPGWPSNMKTKNLSPWWKTCDLDRWWVCEISDRTSHHNKNSLRWILVSLSKNSPGFEHKKSGFGWNISGMGGVVAENRRFLTSFCWEPKIFDQPLHTWKTVGRQFCRRITPPNPWTFSRF